jgi:hypothetical protein
LQIQNIQDPALARLTVTGAQLIGIDYATSMIGPFQWQHFDGRPASGNAFDLNLNRLNDVQAVLGVLSHAPYKLAFLWDLPDTVAVYEVDAAPTSRDIASFLACLGDAEARPAFDVSRAAGP